MAALLQRFFNAACSSISNGSAADQPKSLPENILTFSAKDEETLEKLLEHYQNILKENHEDISDIAFTTNTQLEGVARPYRAAIVGESAKDITRKMQEGAFHRGKCDGVPPKICFLFAGQGSQYLNMGKQLYQTFPSFKLEMDNVLTLFLTHGGVDIRKLIFENGDLNNLESTLAIFCVEICISRLFESWGVTPDFVLGHSQGEFAAAVVAGYLTLEEAVKIQLHKYLVTAKYAKPGCMVSVKADSTTVDLLLNELQNSRKGPLLLEVACYNSPSQIVLGGCQEDVECFIALCETGKIKTKIISQKYAFHTSLQSSVVSPYEELIKETLFHPKRSDITFISSRTGEALGESMNYEYWTSQITGAVNFTRACETIYNLGVRYFLEVSPHAIISPLLSTNVEGLEETVTIPSMKRGSNDLNTVLNALALLHVNGIDINWSSFYKGFKGKNVSLPSFPNPRMNQIFEYSWKKRFHPLLGSELVFSSPLKIFQSHVSISSANFLEDHVFNGNLIFPAAGYVEIMLSTFSSHEGVKRIEDFEIHAPRLIHPSEGCDLQTIYNPESGLVTIYGKAHDSSTWRKHATGTIDQVMKSRPQIPNALEWLTNLQLYGETNSVKSFYTETTKSGFNFGPAFQCIKKVWKEEGRNDFFIEIETTGEEGYTCHPLITVAMIQSILLQKYLDDHTSLKKLFIPVSIKEYLLFGEGYSKEKFYAKVEPGRVLAFTSDGLLFAEASGIEFISTNVTKFVQAGKKPCREIRGRSVNVAAITNVSGFSAIGGDKIAEVADQIRGYVRKVLNKPFREIDNDMTLEDLGFDSLMLIELKNSLQQGLLGNVARIPLSKVSEGSTILSLQEIICDLLNK